MRVAPKMILTSEEQSELARIVASRLSSDRLSLRAQMVLLAADGLQNKEIADDQTRRCLLYQYIGG